MNKRELRQAVRLRNGIPDTGDGLAGHTDIDDCVQAGLRDIAAEKRWPWLLTSTALTFSTSTGLVTSGMPTSYAMIHKLVIGGRKAEYVPLDEFVSAERRYVWTDIGNNIQLYPVPSTAPTATLYYWQDETDLLAAPATDASAPLLPATFHQILVARASYHLNARRGRNAEMARDLTEYQQGLKNLMAASVRSVGPRTIRSAYRDTTLPARW